MMYSTNQNVVQQTRPISRYEYPNYGAAPNLGLAITQLTIGCLCVIFNIPQIIIISATGFIGIGIWGGVPMIIAGSFGIAASRQKGKCTILTTLIMSIVSVVMALGICINFAIGVAIDSDIWWSYHQFARIAIGVIFMVLGVSEIAIGIMQAVYSGKVLGSPNQGGTNVYQTSFPANIQPQASNLQHSQGVGANQQVYAMVQGQLVPVGMLQQPTVQTQTTLNASQLHTQNLMATAQPPPAYSETTQGSEDIAGVHNVEMKR